MTTEKPTKAKSSKAAKKSAPVQLGWNDWAETVKPPSAPSKLSASSAPPVAEPARNWSKLDFTKPAQAITAPETVAEASSVNSAAATTTTAVAATTTVPAVEPQVLTVGQLNKLIRRQLETEFSVVWLKGEISNFKAHPSGHFYFSLKDKDAQISAVMFRGYNSQLRFKPEDGMEVIVRGKITVYEPRGNYQIMCETMEPVGAGQLQKAFEQLKRKLQAEGLFDQARKRTIPAAPKHIAIVTSPSGAAIRDMLNVLGRRYKAARITVVPCAVQGVRATGEIVKAIGLANQLVDVDVLIVGRGGGSIEDMWSFNEEAVARAIAGSRVPVISAVGHEIDFTIADFVADLRAPTPSAAAELVAKNAGELSAVILRLEKNLAIGFHTKLRRMLERVRMSQRLLVDPRRRIEDAILRCDDLMERLERSVLETIDRTRVVVEMSEERLIVRLRRRVEAARARFAQAASLLDGLSPLRVLDRGYALVTFQGRALTSAKTVKSGDAISIRLAEGTVTATVKDTADEK